VGAQALAFSLMVSVAIFAPARKVGAFFI